MKNRFSSAFGASSRNDQHSNGIEESIKQQALAEEEAAMNQYKVRIFINIKSKLISPFLSNGPTNLVQWNQSFVV